MTTNIIFPEECNKYFELQCNNDKSLYTNMPEIKNINKYLKVISPKYVMDIGAGIGRASVFIHHTYGWYNTKFYLLDGNGGDVQYANLRTGSNEFYNSFDCAKIFCEKNNLAIEQLNASDKWKDKINEPIDLIYSFLAIGFHWPIELYLNDLYDVTRRDSLIIFGTRGLDHKSWVEDQIKSVDLNKFVIVDCVINNSKDRDSVLILSKK